MLKMGVKIDQFNQPVCGSFTRKILKDQVCYEIDVNRVKDESESSENMNIGLGFLYDNNVERFLQIDDSGRGRRNDNLGFLNNFVTLEETQKTLVYISSLGKFKVSTFMYISESIDRKLSILNPSLRLLFFSSSKE